MLSGENVAGLVATGKELVTPSEEEIRSFLVAEVARMANLDPARLDINRAFAHYGLDSAQMLEITGQLAEWLGHKLHDSLAWEYPNIRQLSAYLAGKPVDELEMTEEFDEE